MSLLLRILALTIATHISGAALAERVAWEDLVDAEAQVYEDPYLDLEYDQLEDIRTVAFETARLENGVVSETERTEIAQKIDDARSRLSDADIDADWLISQRWAVAERRERAATSVNPELDGKTVTLAGFAIPAPPEDEKTSVIYVVPQRGMCSHVPPPDPNQMVRVRLSSAWTPDMLHQPVRLTGKLSIHPTEHQFVIVDGPVLMRASLKMDAQEIQTLGSFSSRMPAADFTPHGSLNQGG